MPSFGRESLSASFAKFLLITIGIPCHLLVMKLLLSLLLLTGVFISSLLAQDSASLRKERDKLSERGLWRDSLDLYQKKLTGISDDESAKDLQAALKCMQQLGNWKEFDAMVEKLASDHPDSPVVLGGVAVSYQTAPKFGWMIGGEFERGSGSAGIAINTSYRDTVRALQLLRQAIANSKTDAQLYESWKLLSQALRVYGNEWKMQILTPLESLPEWSEPGPQGGTEGAPWGKDGPVTYEIPASWEVAKNDGERWRFALAEMARLQPALAYETIYELANFTQSQFGEQTLASFAWQQDPDQAKGILQLDSLSENECLAKTSDGVRRFKLPAEQHFIPLYRSIIDQSAKAGDALVQIFLNRQQHVKALEVLNLTIAKHGLGPEDSRQNLINQIVGNWGRFEVAKTVPAGSKPSLPLVFRNAGKIKLSAAPVDMEAVLRDATEYLKSNPKELDWSRLEPSTIAQRLIATKAPKFLGPIAENWEVILTPLENHRDTRSNLEVPITQAGAWWISGEMEGGKPFHTLVWIVDSVIVKSDVDGKIQWWLADAKTGAPIADATLQFFGYRMEHMDRQVPLGRRMQVLTKSLQRTTDIDGKTMLKPGDWDGNYQWITMARAPGRATAFYGYQSFYIQSQEVNIGDRDMSYGISDRPLYKPGDTAHVKFYFRNVGYAMADESRWANQSATLVVSNGRGEQVLKMENLKTDKLGVVETEFIIPKEAVLGNWQIICQIGDRISASVGLRVEEFRKPEFEVKVEAPQAPVKLGDQFTATVKATYFHGSPVRKADVEIIVKRSTFTERWFPTNRWDWLYGSGSWWSHSQATWHPTWKNWGCIPPNPPWWQGDRWTPEEVVLKTTLPIDSDGTAKVEIDTSLAKATHGDMDSRFTIEARVVDASRREERATGSVIAARKSFEVIVWTDRGYASAGEQIEATISSATLDGKPISAKGTLKIYQLTSAVDGRIEEEEVQSFPIETNPQGETKQKFAAPLTGQYRLAASLSVADGDAIEGASILNIFGPGRSDPAAWNFGPIELVTDKATYAAGETLKLRINSDHADANVWLFLHITGSNSREARRIQLDGKSLEIDVPLDLRDMPNMFIEAVTVHDAEVHSTVRQVLLPPVSKLIEVTLQPAKDRVKPGETSSLQIQLRDSEGKPIKGTAALTIYDKALEAITGGSNVAAIHQSFWSWENDYNQRGINNSLPSSPGNLLRPNITSMQSLGMTLDVSEPFGGVRRREGMWGAMALAESFMDKSAAAPVTYAPAAPAESITPNAPVRKDFADLLKWSGSIQTDAAGIAEIPIEFPDNLTTWKARVWVLTQGTQVGEGTAEIITSKELLIRLQAPRFLVERDESVFSAVVQNDHDIPKTVRVSLELDGTFLEATDAQPKTIEIAAKSEARVDWRVKALREGEATIRMRADAGDDGDAVERKLPIRVHGMLRQDAWSRVIPADQAGAKISIQVPDERRPEQSKLTVRFSPSIAGAVVDAIPYLASYPNGCTEQTLNRFVPAVIAQQMLKQMEVNLGEVRAKRNNLNPQELGNSADRAAQWKQWQNNPVFDEEEMRNMIAKGVAKLAAMQNSDGGWGWFSGYGESSYPHTTAVVVHGLLIAKSNSVPIPEAMLGQGIQWLSNHEKRQTMALQLHVEYEALRKEGKKIPESNKLTKANCEALDAFVRLVLGEAARDSEPMLAFLHRDRVPLPVYAQVLLALEHHRKGDESRRDEVMKIISQFIKRDPENQTTYLALKNDSYWWNWYGSETETHAWYLKLLSAVKPEDPDTRGLVKYLVNNRKHSTYWESTRDTAFAIEAIASYFKASGESVPQMEVEILFNGKSAKKVSINRDNLFTFDGTLAITGDAVASGNHELEIRRSGKGTLYANAYLEVFTLEDRLRAAGLEVKVTRKVSKLTALENEASVPGASGQIVTQNVERFRRDPLVDGAKVSSGDRIEVELTLESKNDYEYLLFSDAKAAGFEALEALSGYITSDGGLTVYMEPRDRTVDFFIRSLPRGTHSLRYQLRAESPGIYKALPAVAEAMYAPELRANSDDLRLEISDQ